MSWTLLHYERPTKAEEKRILRGAAFYADHNLDDSIIQVLRHLKYDVETARDISAERQPDEFHFRRAFRTKRVLLTQDKDYLDHDRFPLSQTRGVIIFNIDTSSPSEIARALKVVDVVLAKIAPTLNQANVLLNADYTLTLIKRAPSDVGWEERKTRYKLDQNSRDVWMWEEEL